MKKIILLMIFFAILSSYVYAARECECVESDESWVPRVATGCHVIEDKCDQSPRTCEAYCGPCGDEVVQQEYEDCDFNEEGAVLNGKNCSTQGYFTGNLGCYPITSPNRCKFDVSDCNNCGNNSCDNGETSASCPSDCNPNNPIPSSCGNNICESGESNQTCLADCSIAGWNTDDEEWKLTPNYSLNGSADAIIYSDYFDLKADTNYTLSGKIQKIQDCPVVIDFDGGKCTSSTDWTIKNCFANVELTESGSKLVRIPNNPNSSSGLFQNVRLRIELTNCANVLIDDVSLRENTGYFQGPVINSSSGCCPSDYCWDGYECVDSKLWFDATYPPVYSLLNITGLTNFHVLTSYQNMAQGYRCLLDNNSIASWQPVEIKYDWNFNQSGYCPSATDCFVALDYKNENYSNSSCIEDGDFINDSFNIDHGNHYCHNGQWATKTFLIANILENISGSNPYILFCDDTQRIFNDQYASLGISGGCVLIMKQGDEEKVITGFYLEDPAVAGEYETTLCDLYNSYSDYVGYPTSDDDCSDLEEEVMPSAYESCDPVENSMFKKCLNGIPVGQSGAELYVYVNLNHTYFLVSNDQISGLDTTTWQRIWRGIIGFFKKLFGTTAPIPLALTNQTSNYERVYILHNNTLKVYGVEESKYDEDLEKVMTFMYINMTGPGIPEKNKFNVEYINKTLNGSYYSYLNTTGEQSLIIKYSKPSELWPYLTAMLRDR